MKNVKRSVFYKEQLTAQGSWIGDLFGGSQGILVCDWDLKLWL